MSDDFSDRFEFIVDPDAEPVDFDEVLAKFLLAYVRRDPATPDEVPTVAEVN